MKEIKVALLAGLRLVLVETFVPATKALLPLGGSDFIQLGGLLLVAVIVAEWKEL